MHQLLQRHSNNKSWYKKAHNTRIKNLPFPRWIYLDKACNPDWKLVLHHHPWSALPRPLDHGEHLTQCTSCEKGPKDRRETSDTAVSLNQGVFPPQQTCDSKTMCIVTLWCHHKFCPTKFCQKAKLKNPYLMVLESCMLQKQYKHREVQP